VAGANCHSAVLIALGLVSRPRQVHDVEMTYWMHSRLCRELEPSEKAAPGDVVTIRAWPESFGKDAPAEYCKTDPLYCGIPFLELHAYTRVSDDLTFEKQSHMAMHPYRFLSPKDSAAPMTFPAECHDRQGTPKACPGWSNRFRCMTLQEFEKRTHAQPGASLLGLRARIDPIDARLSACAIDGCALQDTEKQVLVDKLQQLARDAEKLAQPSGQEEYGVMMARGAEQHVRSLLSWLANWK
jgi:hypothetical protein